MGATSPIDSQLDWPTWLASINLLQIAIVICALYIVARLLMRFWPFLRKVMDLTSALAQLPTFMAQTTKTLQEQDKKIDEIHHEVNYNNGSSVKDAVTRVEQGVAGLYKRMDAADLEAENLRHDLEDTKPKPEGDTHV